MSLKEDIEQWRRFLDEEYGGGDDVCRVVKDFDALLSAMVEECCKPQCLLCANDYSIEADNYGDIMHFDSNGPLDYCEAADIRRHMQEILQ